MIQEDDPPNRLVFGSLTAFQTPGWRFDNVKPHGIVLNKHIHTICNVQWIAILTNMMLLVMGAESKDLKGLLDWHSWSSDVLHYWHHRNYHYIQLSMNLTLRTHFFLKVLTGVNTLIVSQWQLKTIKTRKSYPVSTQQARRLARPTCNRKSKNAQWDSPGFFGSWNFENPHFKENLTMQTPTIIKSFLLWTKNSHQNDARGTLLSFHLLFCYRRHHENSEHHTLGTQHRTMAPLLPLRLPASDFELSRAQIFEFHSDEMEILWMLQKICDVSNSSKIWYDHLKFHGFETKRHGIVRYSSIAILSCFRVSQGKMRLLLPLQVRCSFVCSMAQVQSIFGWYFQCLNEMKFDIHNQSTVVKQSNKDNKGHVSWILYVRKRLGTFFFWMVNRR